MEAFLFSVNAVLPIILMVAFGYFLKLVGLMTPTFTKTLNTLVFRAFLPVMLFLNVYDVQDFGSLEVGYIVYAILSVSIVFFLSIGAVILFTKNNGHRGVLLQCSFRSNFALVGLPLATSLYGTEGALVATLMMAAIVPFFNIYAVLSLATFRSEGDRPSGRSILKSILKNPLIISIASGLLVLVIRMLFVKLNIDFRLSDLTPIYSAAKSIGSLATPLALLALGAQFEFSAVSSLRREILFGTLLRTVLVPILGLGVAYLFFRDTFTGAHFAAFVAMFATPVAVSSVPMAQEMDADVTLAGQLVVFTTLVSALTIFLFTFALATLGIFPTA